MHEKSAGSPPMARRRPAYTRPWTEQVFSPWVLVPVAVLFGVFVAYQFFHLTPRYIKLVFAIFYMLAVARLPFYLAMCLFLAIFPAPTFVYFGDTNVIFIGLMSVIWIVRMRLGQLPRRLRSPIDMAILVYLLVHFLSMINLTSSYALKEAAQSMSFMTAGVLLFVLLYNAMRTEHQVIRGLQALSVVAVLVDVSAILEHYWGIWLIPMWLLHLPAMQGYFAEGARSGGIFGFHGLLADFSALNFYVMLVLGMRTRRVAAKAYYYALCALSLLMISNSANRGGAVLWALGALYFLWLYRGRIRLVRAAMALGVLAFAVGSVGLLNKDFLYKVQLYNRLVGTHFERGIPETRVAVWDRVLSRIPEHPWLGHGPYIEIRLGAENRMFWPHSAYLFYLYTTGVVGLAVFLWILIKVLQEELSRR